MCLRYNGLKSHKRKRQRPEMGSKSKLYEMETVLVKDKEEI